MLIMILLQNMENEMAKMNDKMNIYSSNAQFHIFWLRYVFFSPLLF